MDILYRPLRMVGLIGDSEHAQEQHPKDLAGYQSQYQQRQQDHQGSTVEQRAADLARGVVYIEDIPPDVAGPARKLLEQYSGIRGQAQFEAHVRKIRDELWKKHPQPSIGHFRFLSLDFITDPCYEIALVRLLASEKTKSSSAPSSSATTFLDVGCGLGQVLRQLALDGVNSSQLYGCDVEPDFIEAGYDLFGDRARSKATFVTGDLVSAVNPGEIPPTPMGRRGGAWDAPEYRIDATPQENPAMDALNGKIDIIHAASLFHLFGWETQKKAAVRMVKLLKKDDPAAMIFGRHVGVSRARNASTASAEPTTPTSPTATRTTSGARPTTPNSKVDAAAPEKPETYLSPKSPRTPATSSRPGSNHSSNPPSGAMTPVTAGFTMQGGDKRFLHDARSWQKLWDEVGEATGTRWRTEVDWLGPPIQSMVDSSGAAVRRMRFAVFRSS